MGHNGTPISRNSGFLPSPISDSGIQSGRFSAVVVIDIVVVVVVVGLAGYVSGLSGTGYVYPSSDLLYRVVPRSLLAMASGLACCLAGAACGVLSTPSMPGSAAALGLGSCWLPNNKLRNRATT